MVDDAHWADPPSLRWLGHLARRIDALPLLVLLAVRSGEPPSDPRLLDDLLTAPVAAPAAARAARRPQRSSARRLVEATPAFCAACHDATGGNPFLLHALAALR